MPLLSGLSTGVKQGTRLSAKAVSIVLWAAKIDPLSESHCTGCGARTLPKRFSTQSIIMLARPPASGMAFEQETVLLHQSVDALGVDRGQTVGSSLALEERGD